MQNSITDISKQVKAEDDLRRSEQRYRDLFESTILGILIFDGQGRPLLVNQATATLFGYDKPEQIVELASIAPLSADPDPKQRLDYQTQRLRGGVLADRFETRGRRAGMKPVFGCKGMSRSWSGRARRPFRPR